MTQYSKLEWNVSTTLGKRVMKTIRSERYSRILGLAYLVNDGINGLETPLLTSDLHRLFFIFCRESSVYRGEWEMQETMDHRYGNTS